MISMPYEAMRQIALAQVVSFATSALRQRAQVPDAPEATRNGLQASMKLHLADRPRARAS